jgi:hypothetical protein
MKNGKWLKKIQKVGISLLTTTALLLGPIGCIPMHAHADAVTNYDLYVLGFRFTSEHLVLNGNVSGTATYAPDTQKLGSKQCPQSAETQPAHPRMD